VVLFCLKKSQKQLEVYTEPVEDSDIDQSCKPDIISTLAPRTSCCVALRGTHLQITL
jgi:hypothetical protein